MSIQYPAWGMLLEKSNVTKDKPYLPPNEKYRIRFSEISETDIIDTTKDGMDYLDIICAIRDIAFKLFQRYIPKDDESEDPELPIDDDSYADRDPRCIFFEGFSIDHELKEIKVHTGT